MLLRLVIAVPLLAFWACDPESAITQNKDAKAARQAEVSDRGKSVMPFDLERTTHRFSPLPTGGLQQVISNDRDPAQIDLIRSHLRREVERFRRGDFSSPADIHGANMPGLKSLSARADQIQIGYSEMPAGAQVSYAADDPELVQALHSWFEAQLSDHGRHAVRH